METECYGGLDGALQTECRWSVSVKDDLFQMGEVMTYFLIAVVLFGSCLAWLHYCVVNAPQMITVDDQERIQVLIGKSKVLRDQLDATTREFIQLHHAETDDEVDELTDCILHDVDYEEVLKRIKARIK